MKKITIALGCFALAGLAQAQTVLKFSTTLPPTNPVASQFWEPWAKRVNELAGKEFRIQVVNGPTLANAVNVWERTVNGVTEMSWGIHGAVNLPFPKSTVISLPLLVEEGQLSKAAGAFYRLYSTGLIADEYKDVRVLGLIGSPVQGISSKKPIASLVDIKGQKVRAADRIVADVVTALGASPVSVPAIETYQALNQGVVSASVAGWVLVTTFKLTEVVTEHLEGLPMGAPAGFIIMNRDAYQKLSPKGKQIMDQVTGATLSREFAAFFEQLSFNMRDPVRKMPNHNFRTLAPAEQERWKQALDGVIKNWQERTPNGAKILAQFREDLRKP